MDLMEARQQLLMGRKNLFLKGSTPVHKWRLLSTMKVDYLSAAATTFIECRPNTTYEVYKIATSRSVLGTTTGYPDNGTALNQYISIANQSNGTITTGADDHYLLVYLYNGNYDNVDRDQMLDSVKVYAVR